MKTIVIAVIKAYHKHISPWLPRACRFTPTCSEYAAEAIERFGLRKGMWKAVKRLLKCHPFHAGGYDPVQ